MSGICSTATNQDRSLLAAFWTRGEIDILELDSGRVILRISQPGAGFTGGAFNHNGTRVVSGDLSGVVTIWDASTGDELASMAGHAGKIHTIACSPDGTRIASGGADGKVVIWDAHSFDRVITLSGHQSYVYSLRFSPDGTQLVSGSGDGTVRIWDSVPIAERRRQARAAEALRAEAAPMVDRLLDELGGPLKVAQCLRGDQGLDEGFRRAALSVLLRRTQPMD